MAAIANNVFIFAARDELTEVFFELRSCNNESVYVSPAKGTSILHMNMGDDAMR
jgi:hypothetical protein